MTTIARDEAPGHRHRHQRARQSKSAQSVFGHTRAAEVQYGRQLRAIARSCGMLARHYEPERPETAHWLVGALRSYAEAVRQWAVASGARMLAEVDARDAQAWVRHSRNMSRALGAEIRNAPTGDLLRSLLAEQVSLISSLPMEAAARVQELAVRGMEGSERPSHVAAEILRTGEVTESRARLIARTEVARASSLLTQARATHVGSEGYIWRTARDRDVRPEHRKLEGKYFRWDDPPVAGSSGERAHAGQIYNCRCNPEPVIPELAA